MTVATVGRILGRAAVTVIVAVILAFLLIELIPGDPAAKIAGSGATPERLEEVREQLGLDRPVHVRFGSFIGRVVRADLGTSLISGQEVDEILRQRIPATASVVIAASMIGVCLGTAAARCAAQRPGSWVDRLIGSSFAFMTAVPSILVGYLASYWFGVRFGLVPTFGYVSPSDSLVQWLHHLVAPAMVLSIGSTILIGRQLRGSLIDELADDTVRFARARGLRNRTVMRRHAMRPALVTVVPLIAVDAAMVLSGAVLVETIFNIPGTGAMIVKAVADRDFPVIQGTVVVAAIWVTFITLIADLIVVRLDPRLGAER